MWSIYRQPTMNAIHGVLRKQGDENIVFEYDAKTIVLGLAEKTFSCPDRVILGIRPEDLKLCPPEDAWFTGELAVVERLGSQIFGYLEIGQPKMLTVEFPRDSELEVGAIVHVTGDRSRLHLFDGTSGQRI